MSKRCSRLLKSAKSLLSRVSFLFMDSAQDSDLAPFLGGFSQSDELSEINLPLHNSEESED